MATMIMLVLILLLEEGQITGIPDARKSIFIIIMLVVVRVDLEVREGRASRRIHDGNQYRLLVVWRLAWVETLRRDSNGDGWTTRWARRWNSLGCGDNSGSLRLGGCKRFGGTRRSGGNVVDISDPDWLNALMRAS